ncbi:Hypothetical predicted protein [Lynx pardinus]|uniref:Uncharacterized protein n=1 Tax=Lynx pardinus TaxID=191816 RepID=A0A485NU70_LYNPA|nr:Hypothetical predicted protein [Lynx pardinus]
MEARDAETTEGSREEERGEEEGRKRRRKRENRRERGEKERKKHGACELGGIQSPAAGLRGPRRPPLPPGAQRGPTAASLGPRRCRLRSRWGAQRAGEPGNSPGLGGPRRRRQRSPGAAGLLRVTAAARFRRDSFPNTSGSLPPRVCVARQRPMDYCSRPGRPPPPARQPPGKSRPSPRPCTATEELQAPTPLGSPVSLPRLPILLRDLGVTAPPASSSLHL